MVQHGGAGSANPDESPGRFDNPNTLRRVIIALCALIIPCQAIALDDQAALHMGVSAAGVYACTMIVDAEDKAVSVFSCSLAMLGVGIAKEVYDHNYGSGASQQDVLYDAAGIAIGAAIAFRW